MALAVHRVTPQQHEPAVLQRAHAHRSARCQDRHLPGVVRRAVDLDPAVGEEDGALLVLVGDREGQMEEHTSELQSLMRTSYAVFCLKKKKNESRNNTTVQH